MKMISDMKEIWRDIEGYYNLYKISNLGRVKSFWYSKERLLKARKHTNGYLRVALCKDGKKKFYSVHRLVALAFLPKSSTTNINVMLFAPSIVHSS